MLASGKCQLTHFPENWCAILFLWRRHFFLVGHLIITRKRLEIMRESRAREVLSKMAAARSGLWSLSRMLVSILIQVAGYIKRCDGMTFVYPIGCQQGVCNSYWNCRRSSSEGQTWFTFDRTIEACECVRAVFSV